MKKKTKRKATRTESPEEVFKRLLVIDKHDLDEELIRQPENLQFICECVALAVSRRDTAKDKLKKTFANLLLDAKANDEKAPQYVLSARVEESADYQEELRALREAEREATSWLNLKESWIQRGYVLKELVQLWSTGYWADPSRSSAPGKEMAYEQTKKQLARARAK
jgi:hypothetical protein